MIAVSTGFLNAPRWKDVCAYRFGADAVELLRRAVADQDVRMVRPAAGVALQRVFGGRFGVVRHDVWEGDGDHADYRAEQGRGDHQAVRWELGSLVSVWISWRQRGAAYAGYE